MSYMINFIMAIFIVISMLFITYLYISYMNADKLMRQYRQLAENYKQLYMKEMFEFSLYKKAMQLSRQKPSPVKNSQVPDNVIDFKKDK